MASGKAVCFLRLLSQWSAISNCCERCARRGQVQKCEQKHSLAAVMVKYSQERISHNDPKRKLPDGPSQGQKAQNVK